MKRECINLPRVARLWNSICHTANRFGISRSDEAWTRSMPPQAALECGGSTPLWNFAERRPLRGKGKRRQAAALQRFAAQISLLLGITVSIHLHADPITTKPKSVQHSSVQMELDKSLRELADLRQRAADQNVALSQELSLQEQQLLAAREELDRVRRALDARNLELNNLRSRVDTRRQESSTLMRSLDDYARSFESMAHIAQKAAYKSKIETAKLAAKNEELTAADVFPSQLEVIEESIRHLTTVNGGARVAGTAVDKSGVLKAGQFAVIGPLGYFRSDDGEAAGLAVRMQGSNEPQIAAIYAPIGDSAAKGSSSEAAAKPVDFAQMMRTTIVDGKGWLPVDTTLGRADNGVDPAAQNKNNGKKGKNLMTIVMGTMMNLFVQGGPIMWPLLLTSIVAVGAVIERLIFRFIEGLRRDPKVVETVLDCVDKGQIDRAIEATASSKDYIARVVNYALTHREISFANAYLHAANIELQRFNRGLPVLDTIITLAPLLGLLGTVTGLIHSFDLLGANELGSPVAITGGIAEALIATAFGLAIAITGLIPFNYFNTRLEEARNEIQNVGTQLELLLGKK